MLNWFLMTKMNWDIVLAGMSGVVQVALVWLGTAIALKPALLKKYKGLIVASFGLIGVAGIVLTICIAMVGSQETARRARENLDAITGGDTYPLITPQLATPPNTFGLIINAIGTNTLSDINFTVLEGSPPYNLSESYISKFLTGQQPSTHVSFVRPDVAFVTGYNINPSLKGISAYTINSFARNGSISEFLEIRFTGYPKTVYEYRYKIHRGDAILKQIDWPSGQ